MKQYTLDEDIELLMKVKPEEIFRILKLYPTYSQSDVATYIRCDNAAAVEAVCKRFNLPVDQVAIANLRAAKAAIWKAI